MQGALALFIPLCSFLRRCRLCMNDDYIEILLHMNQLAAQQVSGLS